MSNATGNDFSFYVLLQRIKERAGEPVVWKDFEELVAELCQEQDPEAIYQSCKYPDIILKDGFGVEAKMISGNINKTINLNSSMPGETCYICAYHNGEKIEHVAAIHGRNFYTPEIEQILALNKTATKTSNPLIKYRIRLMFEIESPFKVFGTGFFIIDRAGGLITV